MRTLKNKTSIKTYISDDKDHFFETIFGDGVETRFVFSNMRSTEVDIDDIIEAAKEHKKFLGEYK
ncbi:hypothetical protein EHQ53_14145 [Leptospira langatensis]|uniref:Uncharacterized protein n=1 Tax=Leptospira langatensis TaxID=2484983 RepID=A0ABY2M9A3_9LEPT|nr:hypothetical protein [Leptospira langatensis]TGL39659.1 hypothetical protein EHQ53_14145 [Leptospira langatensis]